jgi:hypothetical protein
LTWTVKDEWLRPHRFGFSGGEASYIGKGLNLYEGIEGSEHVTNRTIVNMKEDFSLIICITFTTMIYRIPRRRSGHSNLLGNFSLLLNIMIKCSSQLNPYSSRTF